MCERSGLGAIIRQEIEQRGKISFAEYMAQALYHPELGYYTRPGVKIGPEGDFYTSPMVHPVFGACLAKQFKEMWDALGTPETFLLVEYGAGNGLLARDILEYAKVALPDFYSTVQYFIVEISPFHRSLQRAALQGNYPVYWTEDLQGISQEVVGCVFSNEFLDALPVHRVALQHGELKELYVSTAGERLVEVMGAPSTQELAVYLKELNLTLQEQQEVEINLEALKWLQQVAGKLKKGFVLTIDYGYKARELSMPQRFQGTLLCYRQHQAVKNPYLNIGEQDITAHVNFTALEQYGERYGLKIAGFTTQMKFLIGLGIMEFVESRELTAVERQKMLLAVKRLIMPQGMGESFRVMIQYKGLEGPINLSGLRSL
ncbi:class I SAM-dependent methyltransferase [Zhaonella formicivorans]|uniref:class I SAM-dependent methyltransferase n=1 Tax=Zhaonella formicivorans TaxID=2528593 RepID=UPI0010E779DA|nr:SAM-dependent methyltransferase [Zhaonella formicivorans]